MNDFQERVVTEHSELQMKLTALARFIQSEKFLEIPEEEQNLLQQQFQAMNQYLITLAARITIYQAETHD